MEYYITVKSELWMHTITWMNIKTCWVKEARPIKENIMYGFVYLFYLCEQALMIIEVRIVVISGRGVYTEKIQ